MKVRIGEILDTGEPLMLDVPVFIETRGLVVANSGGGKSYLLRVLAEQMSKYVQCGIIARSDEFATIREKYDFLLCGDDKSDSPISYHTAQLKKESAANKAHNERELQLEDDSIEAVRKMVRLLMEAKSHFVVDLSAITNVADRAGFAAAFLNAAAALPRKLWHSVLVPIDEIHLLAPEEGKPVSKQPTIDIFSLTRKMGLCGVGATQRFSKLDKDAGAEANNVLVGRTVLDEDLRRAAKLLGFGAKRWDELKHLNPGEWFIFGPAFGSKEVMKVRIDEARTTHPRPGRPVRRRNFRKPSAAMKRALRELVVLPGKVVERRETIEALHAQITKLEGELKMAKGKIVATTTVETREVEVKIKVPVLTKAQEKLLKRVDANLSKLGKLVGALRDGVEGAEKKLGEVGSSVARITVAAGSTTTQGGSAKPLPLTAAEIAHGRKSAAKMLVVSKPSTAAASLKESPLKAGAREMLRIMCIFGKAADRATIATLAGIAPTSGTSGEYFAALIRAGFAESPERGQIAPTAAGLKQYPEPGSLTSLETLLAESGLKAGARRMVEEAIAAVDAGTSNLALTRGFICEKAAIDAKSGTAGEYFAAARRLGFFEFPNRGEVELTRAVRIVKGWEAP